MLDKLNTEDFFKFKELKFTDKQGIYSNTKILESILLHFVFTGRFNLEFVVLLLYRYSGEARHPEQGDGVCSL